MRLALIPLVALGFLTAACGATASPGSHPAASPSPSAGVPTAYKFGSAILTDALDKDNGNGWPVEDTATHTTQFLTGYAQPGYALKLKAVNRALHVHPTFSGVSQAQLHNYAVVASNTVPGLYSVADDEYGLTCRDLNGKYYAFTRSYDSEANTVTFKIFKEDQSSGSATRTTLGTKTVPSANHEGTITAVCRGGASASEPARLQFVTTVDLFGTSKSEMILDVKDTTAPLAAGYAGVYLGGTSTSKPSITFSDFRVYAAT